jgi:hypothetical protein
MSDKVPSPAGKIVGVDRLDGNAVLVEYSDNMTAVYTEDQLAAIMPKQVAVAYDEREEEFE